MERNGIAVAGVILVDKINSISAYPECGQLTQIKDVSVAVGGCVPNVAIDIKRLSNDLNVKAIGKIGKDAEGEYALNILNQNGVDTKDVIRSDEKTSFTEVMSVAGGQRTFFTYAGCNATFGVDDIDFDSLDAKMLHLGYFLLMDKVDNGDGLKILKKAKEHGIKTSIDLVSENSNRYSLVLPCLKYTDNLIVNEIEAGMLTGIKPTDDNLVKIAKALKDKGVSERVIIHTPTLNVCVSNDSQTVMPSFKLPDGFIKGTTGAGDAFCAGALYSIYNEKTDEEILKTACLSAVSSLTEQDAVSGVRSISELYELQKQYNLK